MRVRFARAAHLCHVQTLTLHACQEWAAALCPGTPHGSSKEVSVVMVQMHCANEAVCAFFFFLVCVRSQC